MPQRQFVAMLSTFWRGGFSLIYCRPAGDNANAERDVEKIRTRNVFRKGFLKKYFEFFLFRFFSVILRLWKFLAQINDNFGNYLLPESENHKQNEILNEISNLDFFSFFF